MVELRTIAEWIQGTLEGDGSVRIADAKIWSEAGQGDITFLEDARRGAELANTPASAVIIGRDFPDAPDGAPALIRVDQPLLAFCTVFARLRGLETLRPTGIHPTAVIAPTARLGADVYIGPYACIGEDAIIGDRTVIHAGVVVGSRCHIGSECEIHPRVVLYPNTWVGNRVIIHAGAVIGADGFGYREGPNGPVHVPQLGRVVIEDDVEIGANTTIDRATFTETRVGRATKIDNLVQVGHNCRLGPANLIAAQVGIAGSTSTGAGVRIGGQAGLRDHLKIGDGVTIGAMAGVMASIESGQRVVGIPAQPEREAKRTYALFLKLGKIWDRVLEYGRRLETVEERLRALLHEQQMRKAG